MFAKTVKECILNCTYTHAEGVTFQIGNKAYHSIFDWFAQHSHKPTTLCITQFSLHVVTLFLSLIRSVTACSLRLQAGHGPIRKRHCKPNHSSYPQSWCQQQIPCDLQHPVHTGLLSQPSRQLTFNPVHMMWHPLSNLIMNTLVFFLRQS